MTKWESKTLFIFPFSFMWSKRCLIELKNDFGLVCFCTTLTRPLGLLCLCLSCLVCFQSHHRYPYNVQERGECFVVFDYVLCVCTLAIWDSFFTHPFCIFGKIFFDCDLVTVTGTLKGYDQLLNLVLDEAVEFLRGNCSSACWWDSVSNHAGVWFYVPFITWIFRLVF